jgi:hypothetical protein
MNDQMTLEQFGQRVKAKYPEYGKISDTDIANKVLAKYPQYRSVIAPPVTTPMGELRPLTDRERFLDPELYPVGAKGEGVGENIHNLAQRAGVGVFQFANAVVHPRQTLAGLEAGVVPEPVVKQANRVVDLVNKLPGMKYLTTKLPENSENPVESGYKAVQPGGWQAAGAVAPLAGQALAGEVLPPVVEGITSDARGAAEAVPKAASGSARRAAGAGPKTVKDLVNQTREHNDALVAKYGEDLKAARQPEGEASPSARKFAMQRGVEKLSAGIQDELKTTEKNVNAEANRRYAALKKSLGKEESGFYQPKDEEGHILGEPIPVPDRLYQTAESSMRGSESRPPIVNDLARRVQHGDTSLTYNDLQGYREEIGRELRKGTLPPDVFDAYKRMMPQIDEAMQEIADRKGLGKAQTAARTYYRNYAQAFLDKGSPIRKALDAPERGGTVDAFRGADQAGVQRLAQFNPELARRINTVRGYADQVPGIKGKEPVSAVRPTGFKRVGPEEVAEAKGEGVKGRVRQIEHKGYWLAIGPVFYTVSDILRGDMPSLAGAGASVAAPLVVQATLTRLLTSPKVVDFLTKATPEDIASIPPQLRGDFPRIVAEAQKRGIKVSPALTRSFAAASAASPRQPQ